MPLKCDERQKSATVALRASEARRPLGLVVVGGLLVSPLLTLYITPVVYLYLDRARTWWERRRSRRSLPTRADA